MHGGQARGLKAGNSLIRVGGACAALGGGVLLLLAVLPPSGATAAPTAGARDSSAARPAFRASVPGTPGTPQAPTVVYTENFENDQGTVPIRLTSYAGATGETYTAAQAWLQNCNGWIAAFQDPGGSSPAVKAQEADCTPAKGGPGATGETAWNAVRTLAQALGVLNGTPNPNTNHAVSAYTNGPVNNGNPGANKVEFQTVQPIPVTENGRFLTFSVNVAETSCTASNHAKLDFYLVNGTALIPVTSGPIDPCGAGGHTIQTGVIGGTFTGNAPVLFTGTSLGIQLINEQGSGDGNDHAFDDIKVLDVTPQLDKSFSPDTAQVGGTSTLTFTITNTSDLLAKSGWSFTDTLPAGLPLATPAAAATTCAGTVSAPDGGTAVSIAGGGLAAGQASCTVKVNVTSATASTYTNDASDITRSTGVNPPGSSTVTFTSTPTIGLVKSVSPALFSAAGQTLSYSYLVTNPSAVPLTGITVTDTSLPGLSAITCPDATLAAGASETCTATYVTTAADLAAGSVTNTATATGTPPTGPAVTSDPSTAVVPALVAPSIALAKSATPTSYSAASQLINYDYLVTNTSPVILSAITVNDTLPGLTGVSCPQATLAPTESEECTATYHTTAADLDAGSITNTATAQGDPPGSTTPVISDPATVVVPAVQRPAITILKSAAPGTFAAAGQTISYSYLVTNPGNVTLTGITVNDDLPGLAAVDCPSDTLPAGVSQTCTASYTTTAADLTAGTITNTATATGTPPAGPPATSGPCTATVTAVTAPAITIDKSATPDAFAAAGQTITFSYLVTNTGNATLTGVTVNDDLPGLSAVDCPDTTLAISDSETCTATYTTTAADLTAGAVINSATAQGFPPNTAVPVISRPSTAIVPTADSPAITIDKTASPATYDGVGQTITYSYLVTNSGNVPLTGVAVTDNLPGLSAISCPATTLDIGASETCTASYAVTGADLDAGLITDTATAQGLPPASATPVISDPSTAVVSAVERPALRIVKSESPATYSRAGQVIRYSFRVTNTGNVTLINVHVNDKLNGLLAITCPETTLAAAQSETCTASYRITAADLNAGHVTNSATAQGDPPHRMPPDVSPPSTATDTAVQRPGIKVVKTATPHSFAETGQLIRYVFRVTNTGNVTLTHVHVTDTLKGLSAIDCPKATLAEGQSEACTATYRITAADLTAGHVTNSATAHGDPSAPGRPVASPPSAVTIKGLPTIPVTG